MGRRGADGTAIGRRSFLAAAGAVAAGWSLSAIGRAQAQAPNQIPSQAPPVPARGQGFEAAPRLSAGARHLLNAQPGTALLGGRGIPLVTELVDYNAPDWRRSAQDMRELIATDAQLIYAVVQAPRLDIGSVEAARVALGLLAVDSARFPPFYEALAGSEGPIDGVKALNLLRTQGVDHYKIFKASNQPDVTTALSKAVELAAALGMLDPPAYVIGGRVFLGYRDLASKRALIAEARACGGC